MSISDALKIKLGIRYSQWLRWWLYIEISSMLNALFWPESKMFCSIYVDKANSWNDTKTSVLNEIQQPSLLREYQREPPCCLHPSNHSVPMLSTSPKTYTLPKKICNPNTDMEKLPLRHPQVSQHSELSCIRKVAEKAWKFWQRRTVHEFYFWVWYFNTVLTKVSTARMLNMVHPVLGRQVEAH